MTRLMLVTIPTLNRTHNSTLYACGIDSIFDPSFEPGSNLYKPWAATLSLEQATSPHSELANMPLSQQQQRHMMHGS